MGKNLFDVRFFGGVGLAVALNIDCPAGRGTRLGIFPRNECHTWSVGACT